MQAASNPTQAMAASVLILSVSVIGKRLRSPFKAIVPYSASAANRRGYEAAVPLLWFSIDGPADDSQHYLRQVDIC